MRRAPDVVGASEAAEILGVEKQRISRWRDSGRLPEPAADLRSTPVWRRTTIETIARGDSARTEAMLNLLGVAEAAAMLGVDRSQIGRWRRAGRFPAPVLELAAGPLWWVEQIEEFERHRPRRGVAA